MKIISVVGARPEFIQAGPVSRALRAVPGVQEVLVHTGQHYDYRMSQEFFDELSLPTPDYNLGAGSGSPARQTAEILARLEQVLLDERPDVVIVRGDTNSTLAGALAASKLQIPTVHIEAGERSFDRQMPEEINRLVADGVADLHFCASQNAVKNLAREGHRASVYWVGDVMLDALRAHWTMARSTSDIVARLKLEPRSYALVTVHRAATTDVPDRLRRMAEALNQVRETIVFPVHPRTRLALERDGIRFGEHVRLVEPVGYLDMLVLEEQARLIATDSGGVQREAYYLGRPCLTLRETTEWIETVEAGWNKLVGVEPKSVLEAWFDFQPPATRPALYGTGKAGQQIASLLIGGGLSFGQMDAPRGMPAPAHTPAEAGARP